MGHGVCNKWFAFQLNKQPVSTAWRTKVLPYSLIARNYNFYSVTCIAVCLLFCTQSVDDDEVCVQIMNREISLKGHWALLRGCSIWTVFIAPRLLLTEISNLHAGSCCHAAAWNVLNDGLNTQSLQLNACIVTLQNDISSKQLSAYGQANVE
jgi:hypothetical protein